MNWDISDSEVACDWLDEQGSISVTVKGFLPYLLHVGRPWNPLRSPLQWVQRVIMAPSDADRPFTSFQSVIRNMEMYIFFFFNFQCPQAALPTTSFNIQKFYILSTYWIFMFFKVFRTSNVYCCINYLRFYSRDFVCILRSKNRIFDYNSG
jgi:hypothetical protein